MHESRALFYFEVQSWSLNFEALFIFWQNGLGNTQSMSQPYQTVNIATDDHGIYTIVRTKALCRYDTRFFISNLGF